MSTQVSKNKWLMPLAFANIYIIWGSTYLAIRYGLNGFPPFILSGFRFLLAGLILFGAQWVKGERGFTGSNWARNGIAGILTLTGATGLVTWGEQYLSSGETAITAATGPFWFILLSRKSWHKDFADRKVVWGLIVGFAGLLLFFKETMGIKVMDAGNNTMRVIAFLVLASGSICWVLGSLYSKHHRAVHSVVMNTAQQLLVAAMAAFLIGLFKGEWSAFHPLSIPLSAWMGLFFLVVFGSVIAYLSYVWLVSVTSPVIVSTHTYINPLVAVGVGWLFLGEIISAYQFLGMVIILLGVLLTNVSRYKLKRRYMVKVRRMIRFVPVLLHPKKGKG